MGKVAGVPSGAWALRAELRGKKPKKVGSVAFGAHCAILRLGSDSLWAIVEGPKGSGIALRCAWAPGPSLELLTSEEGEIRLLSSFGVYRVRVSAPSDDGLLRVSTTLTPSTELRVPWWPRDLYPLGEGSDPMAAGGRVIAAQRGLNTALLYGKFEPGEGTFFYLQDLTALNDFFHRTGTKPDGVVGGEWPELGYAIPPYAESPLRAGEEVTLSEAFLRLDATPVTDKRAEARTFLEHQAALYPFLIRPTSEFRDWPTRADETIRDLAESPLATVEDGGYRYVRPYVGAGSPDSMSQLAVLSMIHEFDAWRGKPSTLMKDLRDGVYRFFDPEIGAIRRYLSTVEGKATDTIDSWYLYHPLKGLAALARAGDEGARDLFLGSLDFGIQVARCFGYQWPIEFSLGSLEVTKASREPGKPLGQTDAGGLYAYVMLDAYELTGEARYLEEAKQAIRATSGLEFCLVYQTNLTSWGAAACLRLWRTTEDLFFLEQASVFLASYFHNCAMWSSSIGRVSETETFLGVTCLHNGPYLAPFECYESFCAFHECLALGEDDLPQGACTLLAEFIRYALDRAWWFYPSSLKESSIAPSPRNGFNSRKLAFPLEDVYVGGDPAGQVGQEVYGSGAGLAYTTRAFHRLNREHTLFCEYPVRDLEGSKSGVTFRVRGAVGGSCTALVLPSKRVMVEVNGQSVDADRFQVPVGATVKVHWGRASAPPANR